MTKAVATRSKRTKVFRSSKELYAFKNFLKGYCGCCGLLRGASLLVS